MTRVLVVDDAKLFQAGLSAALEQSGFEVVGRAADALTALDLVRRLHPDVVILDVLMPGMSGLDVVDRMIEESPSSRILLLTASESEQDLLKAIKSGARGYIVKDTPMDLLVQSIEAVVAGGAVVSPAMGGKLFDTVAALLRHGTMVGTRKSTLTGRELEILGHVAAGSTSKEIGMELYISENTVKNHVRNILDKLGLHSRGEAVMYAVREGLIKVD